MKKPAMTAAEGAAEERRLWMRKVRALQADIRTGDLGSRYYLDRLAFYGEGRTKRNKAKKGGL